jgi:hypothetical protein
MLSKRQASVLLDHHASGDTIDIAFACHTRGLVCSDHLKHSLHGYLVEHHDTSTSKWEGEVLVRPSKQVLARNRYRASRKGGAIHREGQRHCARGVRSSRCHRSVIKRRSTNLKQGDKCHSQDNLSILT